MRVTYRVKLLSSHTRYSGINQVEQPIVGNLINYVSH